MNLWLIPPLAFVCELVDSTLGMGYGTTLTPLLLAFGFEPLQIIPAVLLSELFTGSAAALTHHKLGNVNFDFKNDKESKIKKSLGKLGYIPKSHDSKIAFVLSICSIIGPIASVLIAINLPKTGVKAYIGTLVLVMGLWILKKARSKFHFSWKRLVGIGTLAAFNKGISGGGYGPLVCSGQILSGISSKKAIAITSFSEAIASFVGVAMYYFVKAEVDWTLAPYLIGGALLSVPISGYLVKKMKTGRLTIVIGIVTVVLGAYTLIKLVL